MATSAVKLRSLRRSFITPEGVDLRLELGTAGSRAAAFLIDVGLMLIALIALTFGLLYIFSGTAGSLSVPNMELWTYAQQPGWYAPLSRATIAPAAFDPLAEQLRHFCAVIAGREQPLISVQDAMATLAVVESVGEAARTGQKISPGHIMEQAA